MCLVHHQHRWTGGNQKITQEGRLRNYLYFRARDEKELCCKLLVPLRNEVVWDDN
jgi:hypothetical protein